MADNLFAKHKGELTLGETNVDCYVLNNNERVIGLRSTIVSIAKARSSSIMSYIGTKSLAAYIDCKAIIDNTMEFDVPGVSFQRGKGISAENYLAICHAYVVAAHDGKLTTMKQAEIAARCSIIMSSCAKVGLIALIDEATGYQKHREPDAMQVKLTAYIADELRAWEKVFPDNLWEEFGRLTQWKGPLHIRPKYWGKLVKELIYESLDPEVADYLAKNKPNPRFGKNWHQWLTGDFGVRMLFRHINEVIGVARTCEDMAELKRKVARIYGKKPEQITVFSGR